MGLHETEPFVAKPDDNLRDELMGLVAMYSLMTAAGHLQASVLWGMRSDQGELDGE